MPGKPAAYEGPRARPVADLPLDALIERTEELARRWAIALICSRPLSSIGEIPLVELSRDAPKLLAQMLRAMQSDLELDRLTGAGEASARSAVTTARGLAATAGAHDSGAAVDAVEAMRGVLWEAMLDELRQPAVRQVGDIADRLGYVCARALAVTLPASAPAAVIEGSRSAGTGDVGGGDGSVPRPSPTRSRGTEALIIDEWTDLPDAAKVSRRAARSAAVAEPHRPAAERPLSWDESPPVPPPRRAPEIEIRDERREEGPAAWIRSIGRELARFEHDERPFAVLLVELRGIDAMRGTEPPGELARITGLIENALEHELQARGSGSLTREFPGRYWLLASATDRLGAEALAERARRAAATVAYRHEQLEVLVGTAICPEDGHDAPALAAQADVELYGARSNAARSSDGARRGSLLASLRSAREGGAG